jgi:hypothetical protein
MRDCNSKVKRVVAAWFETGSFTGRAPASDWDTLDRVYVYRIPGNKRVEAIFMSKGEAEVPYFHKKFMDPSRLGGTFPNADRYQYLGYATTYEEFLKLIGA